jgi:hypothetical protein
MIKHTIQIEWKAHPIDLNALEEWLKGNAGEHYCGNSADSKLKLHFSEEPSQETIDLIKEKWDSLTEEEETAKIAHREKKQKAVELAKQNLLTASLSKLSVAERKLLMSMPLTEEDKEALVVKFKKKLDEDPANDEDVEEGEA